MTQSRTKPKPWAASILQLWSSTTHQLSAPGCEEEQPFSPFSSEGHVLSTSVLWGKLWVAAAMSRADGEAAQGGLWLWKG